MMEADTEVVEDLFLVCRLCIVEKGTFAILLSTQGLIKDIFGVTIQPYDGLSQLLCGGCREKVLEIQNIRTKYIENQDILVQLKESYLQKQEKSNKKESNGELKTDSPNTSLEQNDIEKLSKSPSYLKRQCDDTESSSRKKQMTFKPRIPIHGVESATAPSSSSLLLPSLLVQENDNIKTEIEQDSSETRDEPINDAEIKKEPDELDRVIGCRLADDVMELIYKQEAYIDVENDNALSDMDNASLHSANESEASDADFNEYCDKRTDIENLLGAEFNYCKYFCRMCNKSFDSTVSMKLHIKTHADLIKVQKKLGLKKQSLTVKLTRADNIQCPPSTGDTHDPLLNSNDSPKTSITLSGSTENNENISGSDNFQAGNINCGESNDDAPNIENNENISGSDNFQAGNINYGDSNDDAPKIENIDTSAPLNDLAQSTELSTVFSEFSANNHEPDLSIQISVDNIVEVIYRRLDKYHKTLINTELKQVHKILQTCTSKNMRLLWTERKETECPEIVLKPISNNYKFPTDSADNLLGFCTLLSDSESVDVDKNENSAENNNPEMSMFPIIVGTTSVTPASQAEWIDLDGDTDKVTSDNFEGPISPLDFLKFLLQTQNLILSLESCQDSPIACFKIPVEPKRNFTLSIYCQDNIFTIEASEGANTLDLLKESFHTQWELLASLKERNIQRLILNSSKRVNISQPSFAEKFIKVVRSITGTIRGDSVQMEAPTTFFF